MLEVVILGNPVSAYAQFINDSHPLFFFFPFTLQFLLLSSTSTMAPPTIRDRKRVRISTPSTLIDDDDTHHSNDDNPRQYSDDLASRPCQAERKRELERNRRTLVNIRFGELEKELRHCAPRPDSSGRLNDTPQSAIALPAKGKRIDKEAVLKDAASRLAVQRKDLGTASERITSMSTEIDNLRAEKVELRSDKAYLRNELETARKEVQRLREDNINLWQAFRKASTLKDSLASDIAKIPAELFLRRANAPTDQLAPTLSTGNHMVQQSTTLPMSQFLQTQGSVQEQSQGQALAQSQSLPQQNQQPNLSSRQQHQPTASPTSNETQNTPQQIFSPQLQDTVPPSMNDPFLMCTGPDEIGELLANYVPGFVQNFGYKSQNGSTAQELETNNTAGNTLVTATQNTRDLGHTSPQRPPNTSKETHSSEINEVPTKADSEDADPFSDIAYCV